MKKEHFLQSEGFKTVAASVLSILIGLAVGSIVILIVGLTSPNLSLSSAWDGIRIVFVCGPFLLPVTAGVPMTPTPCCTHDGETGLFAFSQSTKAFPSERPVSR